MDIVDAIYDSLTDEEAFAALPAALASFAGARSCSLQAFTPDNRLLFSVINDHYPLEAHALYVETEMFRHDPWRGPLEQQGRWNTICSSKDLVDPEEYKQSVLYNEFYRKLGDDTAHCMGAVITPRDGNFILGVHRGMTTEPFCEAETAALQPILPHLRRLLAVKAQFQLAKAQAATATGLLDTLPHGVLVVDHTGQLLFANQLGESLLGPGGPLTLRGGGIRAREHRYDVVLVELVLSAGLGARGRGGALSMASADGPNWRVVVAPWRTDGRMRVVIFVDDPDANDPSLATKLASLYGLTASEAATIAALVDGLMPAEAADARGVSLATVRTQIQQALGKANVRTLTELVRLAASLPRLEPQH